MTRHYYFARELARQGHDVTVFAGSHPHNSDVQLINDGSLYKVWQETPFRWIYVKTLKYGHNRIKEILSMFVYYRNSIRTATRLLKEEDAPDVILGSSPHPLAALFAVRWGKKHHCKSIVEIRDLWPESIVALGIAKAHNPAVLLLRRLEKYLYTHADAVVFTMEGAYDYIVEQGWEKDVPREKVHYINNGVDLEVFAHNKAHYTADDPDLDDPDTFKVVYTGSIRLANGLKLLLDCAEKLKPYPDIRILIYGGGSDLETLRQLCRERGITNCLFKGPVPKQSVPYVLSKSDLTLLNYDLQAVRLYQYGSSQNKLFEYLAAGKPVLSNTPISHSVVKKYRCGADELLSDADTYAAAILRFYRMTDAEREALCANARRAAEDYDFRKLTQKLVQAVGEIPEKEQEKAGKEMDLSYAIH